MKTRFCLGFCLGLLLSLFSSSVFAGWALNPSSKLTFVSVKADHVGETHHFSKLSGAVSEEGVMSLSIDLSSLETNIPIRNERMLEYLFEVSRFQYAKVSANVDVKKFAALGAGEQQVASIPLSLDLHGKNVKLKAEVLVTRLKDKQLSVVSSTPILVSAAAFDLVPGIDKLQALAGLPSITKVVPVSFNLLFDL